MTSQNTVNVHLLYMIDDEYTSIKNWTDQALSPGTIVELVDDTWFPSLLPDNSANKTWEPYIYVITDGYDYREEIEYDYNFPAPIQFQLIQNAHNSSTSDSGNGDGNGNSNSSESSSGLKGWMIAVIVIACVLFVAALAALFWLFRRLRRNKAAAAAGGDQRNLIQGNNGASQMSSPVIPAARPFAGSLTNASSMGGGDARNDMSSIHSSTPIVLHGGSQRTANSPITHSPSSPKSMSDFDKSSPAVAHIMQQQEARQSSSILSSTDAIMIADTFRQFMRKPEWNEHHDEEDEEVGGAFKSQHFADSDNEKRKRVGDELLRKELAQEGTSVQQIERRSTRLKDNSTNNDDNHHTA
ncbi:hypothetical protein BDB00DRAFT_623232 [Zychaea mexicana]|uniref:uncharacterized protein n=1 Tax=Zychaea mexicana TaxID=64656 RepID=UPI0022FEB524|nr:uncharacterized protein BDB00DRAFT_623232 [Zychaea mexicana]KAI9497432.1 hypothetical protein BDB00DRAFT_623232 [Zychaea mexicana]